MGALNADKIVNSSDVYWNIRQKLTTSKFTPGQKLKPEELRLEYNCAASTLREVLFRLSCDGLVFFEEHKGFRVPVESKKICNEAVELRILLECVGAKKSIENGDLNWEAKFAAAHHKLAHVEKSFTKLGNQGDMFDIWCQCEWEFHETLISMCGSDLLRAKHRDVYDIHRLHLLALSDGQVASGFREGNISEHQAILNAALDRDIAACEAAIGNHLRRID